MIKMLFIFLILGLNVYAEDFVAVKSAPEKIACTYKNGQITFSDKTNYKVYEEKLDDVNDLICQKILIQGMQFYSMQFSGVIETSQSTKKILIYEVALLEQKSKALKTARSEVIDQND